MNWKRHCERVAAGKRGLPVEEIVWLDACAFGTDWVEKAETGLRLTTTVGYLISETVETVSLVSIINSDHIGHGIVIPVSGIKSRRVLS